MAGTYPYRIEPRDIDATLRVRLYALGDIILQAANDDADMLGFGVRDLNAGVGSSGVEASWVLSRLAIEVRRLPSRHENIEVYTWVSDYGRLMTTRNMVVTDESGEQIAAAVTQWVMIDLATRRPLDLSALSDKSTSLVDREPPIERPRKIGNFEYSAQKSYEVVYSDIDFNGHVNSMKYLEWMVDAMPAGTLAAGTSRTGDSCCAENVMPVSAPVRLDINYIHEAHLGETLTICRNETTFDIRNAEGGSVCRAEFSLK